MADESNGPGTEEQKEGQRISIQDANAQMLLAMLQATDANQKMIFAVCSQALAFTRIATVMEMQLENARPIFVPGGRGRHVQ